LIYDKKKKKIMKKTQGRKKGMKKDLRGGERVE